MQKKVFRFASVILAVLMLASAVPFGVAAEEAPQTEEKLPSMGLNTESLYIEYAEYLKEKGITALYEGEDIVSAGANAVLYDTAAEKKAEYVGKNNVLYWEDGKGTAAWSITVPEDALYNLAVTYIPLKTSLDVEYELRVDGEIPFEGAENIRITRDWKNISEEPRKDAQGNEIAPEQIETGEYVYRLITDKSGVVLEPYAFALTAGTHEISFTGNGYAVAIADIALTAPEKTLSYSEVSKDYNIKEDASVTPIYIHGEDAVLKNDKTLIPKAINGDPGLTPIDPYLTLINNIGGSPWGTPGQSITWEFEVETAGYYQLGARYKQSEVINGESYRWLKIDGKTPFAEAKQLRFSYDPSWDYFEMEDGETPYYIWLDKGPHTLSLEVSLGDMAEFYDRLNKMVAELGNMYLKIVMITGETVDTNRDYELFRQIPEFTDTLTNVYEELDSIVTDIQTLTGKRGSQYVAAINNMKRVLKQMLDAPYIAHIYVSDYYSNYTTLSSWLSDMKKMPVAIDEMQLIYAGQKFDWDQPNFFQKTVYEAKRLISSFVNDYSIYVDEDGEERATLKLWVNWGRDQTMVLNSLIQETFTEEKNINVNIQIVSASLINGLLANNYPDVQLHLARTAPVNYGMRGALLDLTQFEDYKEVLTWFQPGSDTPYWYKDALYAIPDTQSFFCMFYRTDVFEELGLEVPKTWEEFLYCATIIQRYNMDVYVPYTQITTATTVDAGIGSLSLYPTLMMQNGLNIYNEEKNATVIDSVEGIKVFKDWTDFYTDYGYLKEANFYMRLRNGSMPLGIAAYSTYMTIYSAAPEIEGRWTIANVPGSIGGSDVIAGAGTGAGIVKASPNHEAAWEFIKWWTSADTQARYSSNVESVLGMLGRTAPANVEAFKRLAWDPEDLDKLLEQWSKIKEVPEVPGSYYLTRAVDQAFWSVINDNINPKDAVKKWSKIADNEIERKIKQYS